MKLVFLLGFFFPIRLMPVGTQETTPPHTHKSVTCIADLAHSSLDE